MSVLSITRLRLKSYGYLAQFLIHNEKIFQQIRKSEGFIRGKEVTAFDLSMWTCTLWKSDGLLRSFYLNGAHQKAMLNIDRWSSEAATFHQDIDSFDLPSCRRMIDLLEKNGHFTKLTDPSENHCQRVIHVPLFAITRLIHANYLRL